MADSHVQEGGARSWAIWVCDGCGDLAECEPGETCEVCVKGMIRSIDVVPRADAEALAGALEAVQHLAMLTDGPDPLGDCKVVVRGCHEALAVYRAKHPKETTT